MAKARYSEEIKAVLDDLLLNHPEIEASKVFGLACYKFNGTIFATLYADEVGIKLPEDRVTNLLNQEGYKSFMPFRRNRGKQFVAISYEDVQQFSQHEDLLLESAHYVASLDER